MPSMALKEEQLEDFRATLEAEHDSLQEELASHGKNTSGGWQGNSSGLEGEESDPTDAADQIEELVTNVPLVEELRTRQKEVTEAIERIENGTYGVCGVCNEPIDEDRLEANPAARTCVAHA